MAAEGWRTCLGPSGRKFAMTNEELERIQRIERNMDFIVEHQAKFEVEIARINETLNRHNEALDRHAESLAGLLQVSRALINDQVAAGGRLAALEEKQARADERVAELAEKVDAFITFVEKYISSRNGGENQQNSERPGTP
jgi:chromosome segregation ATPase